MSKFTVGLTGGIAAGKSEVSRRFGQLGVTVVDADLVARHVVAPGMPALQSIADRFGTQVLDTEGRLDRAAMRVIIFNDPQARRDLESITHPLIRQAMITQCQEAESAYCIAAIPLLTEAGRDRYPWLDRIVVVDVTPEIQLERLLARDDIPPALAAQMIASQASREQRLAIADHVIDNSGPPDRLQQPVQELHHLFLQLAAAIPDAPHPD